jgi:hypothetical protein
MNKILLFSVCLFFAISPVVAQKVAVCGFTTTGANDGFSFVALTTLTSADIIYFTDGPYVAASDGFSLASPSDAVWQFTPPAAGITQGDVIVVSETSPDGFTLTRSSGSADVGTLVVLDDGVQDFDLTDREPIFSFEASNPASPATTMTELYGRTVIGGTGGPQDGDDPGTDGTITRSPGYASIAFNGNGTQNGQFTPALRAAGVNNASFVTNGNWTTNGTAFALSTTPFSNITFPVEWLTFGAEVQGRLISLSWATGSELNNDFFAVERSADKVSYVEVGSLKGAGTTREIQNYAFIDTNPLNGINYYRLRQVDFDGAFDFSDVVSVELTVGHTISLYPNPVVDYLYVESMGGMLQVYTLAGQKILSADLQAGQTRVDLSVLKTGTWLVEVLSADGSRTMQKLVK